jgi:hypothetical protein
VVADGDGVVHHSALVDLVLVCLLGDGEVTGSL